MEITFEGKRALVTGAGKGIGRAIAIALAKGGAVVYALSRTQADLDSIQKESSNIKAIFVDVGDWAKCREAVEKCGPVELLVNNAGIGSNQSFLEITEGEWESVLNINLKAAVNISQVVAKGMVARKQGGAIVNISSQASMIALPKHTSYAASKAGLDQVTRMMALELGPHNIRTNCVNPGIVMTDMGREHWGGEEGKPMKERTPMKRFAEISDVVNTVLYLLSDQAAMLNGVLLPIEGGLLVT